MANMEVNSSKLVSGDLILQQYSSANKFAAGAKMIEQLSEQNNQAQLQYQSQPHNAVNY